MVWFQPPHTGGFQLGSCTLVVLHIVLSIGIFYGDGARSFYMLSIIVTCEYLFMFVAFH